MPQHDADFSGIDSEQLNDLRAQLKAFVGGVEPSCPVEPAPSDVSKCGGHHTSHVDNDGWV